MKHKTIRIKIEKELTSEIEIESGIRQVDIISTPLFSFNDGPSH